MTREYDSDAWIPKADWRTIDQTITNLTTKKDKLEVEIGRSLLAAQRAHVDVMCGYGSFNEYVERRLGYDARTTREKLRVTRSLEALPEAREQLRTCQRIWSAVRELARVATAQTEGTWLAKTERMTTRQVEGLVRGRKLGDLPTDEKDPLLTPRRIVFGLLPEDYALVEEALEKARQEGGPAASRADALRANSTAAPSASQRFKPPSQSASPASGLGNELVEVSPALAGCARCDGEVVGFTEIAEGVLRDEAPAPAQARAPDGATHVGHEPATESAEAQGERAANPSSVHLGQKTEHALEGPLGARALVRLAGRVFGVPLKPSRRAPRDRGESKRGILGSSRGWQAL